MIQEKTKSKADSADKAIIKGGKKATASQPKTKKANMFEDLKTGTADLWKKVSMAAEKGVEAVITGADKVGDLAGDATQLTKTKVDIHKTQNELNRIYGEIGEKLVSLHNAKKMQDLPTAFKDDFEAATSLQKRLRAKEKELAQIKLG